jgi:integrase
MSKRANGEGTVYQRQDGRWTGATYVLKPDGGRTRRQVYGITRSDVSSKLRVLVTQTERGIPMAGSSWTVASYSAHWLNTILASSVRPSTHSSYSWVMRKYVVPALGPTKLERLTPAHIRTLHAHVAAAGVSARTVQLAHAVLRSMLSEAVREEHISRNVGSLVRPPRLVKTEIKPWSAQEVSAFSAAASSHRLRTLFLVAYAVGLRRGELLGLRWADLELDTGLLHVRQTVQRLGADKGLVLGPPKSARSRRSVPVPASVLMELRSHRVRQTAEHKEARANGHVPAPQFADLVFTTSIGTPLEPSNLRRDFDTLAAAAGLRRIRFHDLRHTCASLLFAQGVPPRVVMDLLGHSTLSITTDLYAHVMPSTLTDAATAMDAILGAPQ